jgi:hypothetical protein
MWRLKFVTEAFFRGQKRFVFNGIKKNLGTEPNFVPAHVHHRNTGWKPLISNDSQKNLRNEPNFSSSVVPPPPPANPSPNPSTEAFGLAQDEVKTTSSC